jgi:hypothetical protein
VYYSTWWWGGKHCPEKEGYLNLLPMIRKMKNKTENSVLCFFRADQNTYVIS